MDRASPSVGDQPFTSRIAESLYPEPYCERLETNGSPFSLALSAPRNFQGSSLLGIPGFRQVARKWSTARYMAFMWQPTETYELADLVVVARKEITKFAGAVFGLRSVGAYVIIVGTNSSWQFEELASLLDTTGLHSVVIQSLHIIDPQMRKSHVVNTEYHRPNDTLVSDISRTVDDAISAFD